ncbi:hypothetical protein [Thiolapillus sp.]|uniref:hypothetical protein n=3 Tax=Thiolapillus sp. TaxID=2017437 RepID=UPI003AF74719
MSKNAKHQRIEPNTAMTPFDTTPLNDDLLIDAYEEDWGSFLCKQRSTKRHPKYLTPTQLAALSECEVRFLLMRRGGYKKHVSLAARRGVRVHAEREAFLKRQRVKDRKK